MSCSESGPVYCLTAAMEVVISRRVLFAVLKENNALAITFKPSVDIALKYVQEKLVGSEAELLL